ncbi:MAG: hypothetical protein FADNKDHG_01109 [Holosporales bacterium]
MQKICSRNVQKIDSTDLDFEEIAEEITNITQKMNTSLTSLKGEYGPLINFYWHSEPRLLKFIDQQNIANQLFSLKKISLWQKIEFITLNIHSTQDCCPSCRMQIVGAAYNWLYHDMISCLRNNDISYPNFHIFVS